MESLSTANFYSFLMDGKIDAGNVENELIVIMSFHKDDTADEVGSFARYVSIKIDAAGLMHASSKHSKFLELSMC